MNVLRFLRRFVLMNAVEDGGGGGAIDATPAAGIPADTAPGAATPDASAEPTSMADAISRHFERDELGRFAPKTAEEEAAAAAAPVAQPTLGPDGKPVAAAPPPVEPPKPEDLLQMPEGLQPKAQERFQALANNNRELTSKNERLQQTVDYVSTQFQQHAVRPEQFEQLVAYAGAVNRGDLRGALNLLDQQRHQLALALGEPVEGVDILANYPDLRQAVDNMQITPQHAAELARARAIQAGTQQREQQATRQQQQTQQQAQAHQQGIVALDQVARRLAQTDPDYPAIEKLLAPQIAELLKDIPPQQFAAAFERQYRLFKQAAASGRVQTPPATSAGTVLRPTGQASPQQTPKSMHEAMWGEAAPTA